jgi:hypothetical protein
MKGSSIKQDSRNEYRHREKLGDSKTTKCTVAMVITCNVRHEYKHESAVPRRQKEPKSNLVLFLFSDTQKGSHFTDVPEWVTALVSERCFAVYVGKEISSSFMN